MRLGYFTGDPTYVKFKGNNAVITVPKGKSAVLVLRALYSGNLHITVGEDARLILSAIDEPVEKKHKISVDVNAQKSSTCIITFNFKGRSVDTAFNFSGQAGQKSRLALNTVLSHSGIFFSDIKVNLNEGAKSQINGLVNPFGKGSETILNIVTNHLQGNSSNSIEWVGSLKDGDRCNFKGEIYVPGKLKNVETSLRGRFMASKDSTVHALPILRIHSRDVRASHGVSVSNLSRDELNYMESRGISPEDANALAEQGLLSNMLNRMAQTFKI